MNNIKGAVNEALYFNGTDDYINCGNTGNITADITLCAWVYYDGQLPMSSPLSRIILNKDGNNAYRWQVHTNGEIKLYLNGEGGFNGYTTTDYVLPLSQWVHLAVTVDFTSKKIIFYADGKQITTFSDIPNTSISGSSNDLLIGAHSTAPSNTWSGYLDDVRIYDYALNSQDVSLIYYDGKGTEDDTPTPKTPYSNFNFNLKEGSSGYRQIYFKTKNEVGQSIVTSTGIYLQGPTISIFNVNNGSLSTDSVDLTINSVCTNNPTHYMISENKNFNGSNWHQYTQEISYTLQDKSIGYKTLYFKVKNNVAESSVSQTFVNITPPVVSKLLLNHGAVLTTSQYITVTSECSGKPTYYMLSEDYSFSNSSWKPYLETVNYILRPGINTSRTIYYKVKNDLGESTVKSAVITIVISTQRGVYSLSGKYNVIIFGRKHKYDFFFGNTVGNGIFDGAGNFQYSNLFTLGSTVTSSRYSYSVDTSGQFLIYNMGVGYTNNESTVCFGVAYYSLETGIAIGFKSQPGFNELSVKGRYDIVAFVNEDAEKFTSAIGNIEFDGSGAYTSIIEKATHGSNGKVLDEGETNGNYIVSPEGQLYLGDYDTGCVSIDGNIIVFAPVPGDTSNNLTGITIGIKQAEQLADGDIDSTYNLIVYETDNDTIFTSGMGTVEFDGIGNYTKEITHATHGQTASSVFTTETESQEYLVDGHNRFYFGDYQRGFVGKNSSTIVFSQVPGSRSCNKRGISFLMKQPEKYVDTNYWYSGYYEGFMLSGSQNYDVKYTNHIYDTFTNFNSDRWTMFEAQDSIGKLRVLNNHAEYKAIENDTLNWHGFSLKQYFPSYYYNWNATIYVSVPHLNKYSYEGEYGIQFEIKDKSDYDKSVVVFGLENVGKNDGTSANYFYSYVTEYDNEILSQLSVNYSNTSTNNYTYLGASELYNDNETLSHPNFSELTTSTTSTLKIVWDESTRSMSLYYHSNAEWKLLSTYSLPNIYDFRISIVAWSENRNVHWFDQSYFDDFHLRADGNFFRIDP